MHMGRACWISSLEFTLICEFSYTNMTVFQFIRHLKQFALAGLFTQQPVIGCMP